MKRIGFILALIVAAAWLSPAASACDRARTLAIDGPPVAGYQQSAVGGFVQPVYAAPLTIGGNTACQQFIHATQFTQSVYGTTDLRTRALPRPTFTIRLGGRPILFRSLSRLRLRLD